MPSPSTAADSGPSLKQALRLATPWSSRFPSVKMTSAPGIGQTWSGTYDHTRIYRTAALARHCQAVATGLVGYGELPGPIRRPHAADQHRGLVLHAQTGAEAGRQMELGGVQRPAADPADPRHPLRHQMVEARHALGRRADRRCVQRRRRHAADQVHPRPFLRRLFE